MPTKVKVTNKEFLEYENEAKQIRNSIFFFLLNSKLNEWWNNNRIPLKTIHDKRAGFVKEFYELDDKEKIKLTELTEEEIKEGKKPEPILKEGKTEEDFKNLLTQLMNTENTMTV